MPDSHEFIIVERRNGVATVTLNRPDRHNAINAKMRDELTAALAGIRDNDGDRAVVLTGAAPSFCSGQDLGARA